MGEAADPILAALETGIAHQRAGRFPQAEAVYRDILTRRPNHPPTLHQLGLLAMDLRRPDVAVNLLRAVVRMAPNPPAHAHLATALAMTGDVAGALPHGQAAVAGDANCAAGWRALAYVYDAMGREGDAETACARAIAADPTLVDMQLQYAHWMILARRFDDAAEAAGRALALRPDIVQCHWNRAVPLLLAGRWAEAWPHFKRYPDLPAFAHLRRDFYNAVQRWDGEDLAGKTLLLHASGGFGDAIQYVRYVPLVAERWPGGRIVLECPPSLVSLFRTVAGADELVPRGQPLPRADYHATLQLLPAIFGTTVDTAPAAVPYLTPDPGRVAYWRERLKDVCGKKAGLVWRGSDTKDDSRILSVREYLPFTKVEGVRFVSLQKGTGAAEAPPAEFGLIDWTKDLGDFADTAALAANLDLVITVDTSVAHLAGAIGKPVWVFIQQLADFRWTYAHPQTPWYPTMRLFRQSRGEPWAAVVGRVTGALRDLL